MRPARSSGFAETTSSDINSMRIWFSEVTEIPRPTGVISMGGSGGGAGSGAGGGVGVGAVGGATGVPSGPPPQPAPTMRRAASAQTVRLIGPFPLDF